VEEEDMRLAIMNRLRRGGLGVLTLGLFAAMFLPISAHGESAEAFFSKTRRITFYIALGPGSGDDVWARLVSKYMSKYLPGHPSFIVTEMPGAGSLIEANFLYNRAPQDGTAIGGFSPSLPAQVLVGLQNAHIDPTKFSYIGSPQSSDDACVVMASSGIKTIQDAQMKSVMMGGNGPTTVNSIMPKVLNQLIGTKFKVVEGYKSVPEVFLAMQRGEVDGQCSRLETIEQDAADDIKSGKMTLLLSLSKKPTNIQGLPTVFDYIKNDDDRRVMSLLDSSIDFGRPYVAPPGIPQDRLALLRKAFEETMNDPDFLAAAAHQHLVPSMKSGEALQVLAVNLYDRPKADDEKAKVFLLGDQ
jgi:tripartite-type tricarboxylate transporter receptor subunit TctC